MTATPPASRARVRSKLVVQRARRGTRAAPASRTLLRFARAAAGGGLQATLRVVGSAEARRLNLTFRKRAYASNVLAFRYGRAHGDIVLCHAVIAREARAQGKQLLAHYAHMVVHGVLHLRGHDHEKAQAAARMEQMEIRILGRLGFADPYTVK